MGVSVNKQTNTLNNIIGVSLYNNDVWNGGVIGITVSAIATSINNLGSFGVSHNGLITTGISRREDIVAGISFRNNIGISYTGLITTGISHRASITLMYPT